MVEQNSAWQKSSLLLQLFICNLGPEIPTAASLPRNDENRNKFQHKIKSRSVMSGFYVALFWIQFTGAGIIPTPV